jgi:hypothetical protein
VFLPHSNFKQHFQTKIRAVVSYRHGPCAAANWPARIADLHRVLAQQNRWRPSPILSPPRGPHDTCQYWSPSFSSPSAIAVVRLVAASSSPPLTGYHLPQHNCFFFHPVWTMFVCNCTPICFLLLLLPFDPFHLFSWCQIRVSILLAPLEVLSWTTAS